MKKTIRTILSFVLMTAMFLAGTVTAFAEDGVENPYIETMNGASVMGTSPVIFRDVSTGMPAYCIDYNRGIPSPESLSGEFDPMTIFDANTYRGLEYLLLAGYPFETGGLSNSEAQACTQLAVWCWTRETMGYGLNASNYSATPGREDVYEYFTGLMEAARNQTPPDIGIDCADIALAISGDILIGTTTVTTRNLNSYKLDESVLPAGITVTGYTGASGDVLTFTAGLDYAGESITLAGIFTGQDTRSALNLFWYDNSNPNQQRMVISYYDESTIAVSSNISLAFEAIPEPTTGWIKLTKTAFGDDGVLLPGAVFGVYDAATDEKLGELTTGEDGTATMELPICEVYLLEQTAPEGYALSADRINATVIGGETVEVTAVNELLPPAVGTVKLIKKSAAEETTYLHGAVFGVYDAATDEKLGELATGEDGTATMELPICEVYLLEQTAPEGYILSTDRINVTIISGETVEVTAVNELLPPDVGSVKLIKKSANGGILLPGAMFGVYDAATDQKLGEPTTGEDGTATIELPVTEVYLLEQAAPEGFKLSADRINVTVIGGETVEITVINEAIPVLDPEPTDGRIKLIKKDADVSKFLSGAVFGIYRASNDVKVGELVSGSDGTAVSALLPAMDYYLKEQKSPDSYELSADKHGVTVKAGDTVTITITNKKIPSPTPDPELVDGKIKLIKKDAENGKLLANALFGVYRVSDDVKVGELETNSKGEAKITLPAAEYYLKELKSPDKYELSKEKFGVTVKAGKVTEITITNPKIPETKQDDPAGEMFLIKKAAGTAKRLSGAVFGIYRASDGVKLTEVTTGSDGTAALSLEPNNYYCVELKAPAGFTLDNTKIPFTIKNNEIVEVEVTNVPVQDATKPDEPKPTPPVITIPKTGEAFPVMNYTLAAFCMGLALVCGVKLRRRILKTA